MPGADERARQAVEAALAAVDDGPVMAPAGSRGYEGTSEADRAYMWTIGQVSVLVMPATP
jgi:hypothetical protein